MRKEWLKKMILSLIAVGIITSHIAPQQTFADDSIQQEDEYDFGPGKLQDELAILTNNLYFLDLHAKIMYEQVIPSYKNISLIDEDLKNRLQYDQRFSKIHGKDWLDFYKPLFIKTIQNIAGYNEQFQSHYNNLITALKEKNIEAFKSELSLLYNDILNNKEQVDNLSGHLISFRDKLTTDTNYFKSDINELTSILATSNIGISLLQKELERYYQEVKTYEGVLIFNKVLNFSTIGRLFDPLFDDTRSNLDNAYYNIEQLKQRISGTEKEVAFLTDVEHNYTRMTEIMDSAITSLENISTYWYTIASNYRIILRNIDSINPERLTFIENKLNTAKDNWENLKESADNMSQSLKDVAAISNASKAALNILSPFNIWLPLNIY